MGGKVGHFSAADGQRGDGRRPVNGGGEWCPKLALAGGGWRGVGSNPLLGLGRGRGLRVGDVWGINGQPDKEGAAG